MTPGEIRERIAELQREIYHLEELLPEEQAEACKHDGRRITKQGCETFLPREGCLECNEWLEPVALRP